MLSAQLRPHDALGRIGGDEFALLLPGVAYGAERDIVDRLHAALQSVSPASIGYSSFPLDGTTSEELFHRADEELYAVKGTRRAHTDLGPIDLSWAATLADAVDRRMEVAHDHSRCVADLAAQIARELGWDEGQIGLLRLAGTLHDVGKVAVPDAILRKPGPLTPEEYEIVKTHSVIGAEMVARIPGMESIVPWIRHSHEHIDGSGYPDCLSDEAIPLASRILLVADAFDAMTSSRSYRGAMPAEEALAELRRHAGTQFDDRCVDALANLKTGV